MVLPVRADQPLKTIVLLLGPLGLGVLATVAIVAVVLIA